MAEREFVELLEGCGLRVLQLHYVGSNIGLEHRFSLVAKLGRASRGLSERKKRFSLRAAYDFSLRLLPARLRGHMLLVVCEPSGGSSEG